MTWEIDPRHRDTGLPLEGVRVLDFSRVLAGPLAAMVLGDLGADVIKIESPAGDPVRFLAPPRFGEDATYYLAVNRHRRNVVADLRDPLDYAAVARLLERADVVIENYLPSQRAALGIDQLRERAPGVVWVSVTPSAPGTDLEDRPAFDLLAQARGGLMDVTGEREATKVGAPLSDVVTGLYAAIAALAGLVGRSDPGPHFQVPLLDATLASLINQAQGYLATGLEPRRLGNDHPSIAPYGPVHCADGVLLLAVGTDAQFARLVEVLGEPSLGRDDWRTNAGRVEDRDDLRARLNEVMGHASREEWGSRLDVADIPYAPVLSVAEALDQPAVSSSGLVVETDSPAGVLRTVSSPLFLNGERLRVRSGPRRLGEDSALLERGLGDDVEGS
ncbi:MAG: CoA transferase [Acidimicrobiaceae bacterium]|nr:CoA transferase [Acidimicrobiaceae bacterium]